MNVKLITQKFSIYLLKFTKEYIITKEKKNYKDVYHNINQEQMAMDTEQNPQQRKLKITLKNFESIDQLDFNNYDSMNIQNNQNKFLKKTDYYYKRHKSNSNKINHEYQEKQGRSKFIIEYRYQNTKQINEDKQLDQYLDQCEKIMKGFKIQKAKNQLKINTQPNQYFPKIYNYKDQEQKKNNLSDIKNKKDVDHIPKRNKQLIQVSMDSITIKQQFPKTNQDMNNKLIKFLQNVNNIPKQNKSSMNKISTKISLNKSKQEKNQHQNNKSNQNQSKQLQNYFKQKKKQSNLQQIKERINQINSNKNNNNQEGKYLIPYLIRAKARGNKLFQKLKRYKMNKQVIDN